MRFSVGTTYLRRVSTCATPVTAPYSGTIGPTPCREKQPQCMRLGLCFTVAERHSSAHSSAGSRHTRLLRLCWNWEKVDSSLHKTFPQSLVVQCSYSRHH